MRSVERVSRILIVFAEKGLDPLGVSEIARRAGLPKSLTFRVLTSLTATGFLEKDERARYGLGRRIVELGLAALRCGELADASMPHMQRLSDETEETITLTLRVGYERTYVAQVVSRQDVRKTVRIGERYPLYAGNSGRAILAWFTEAERAAYFASVPLVPLTPATICDRGALERALAEVRQKGYAVSKGERDAWSAGVGAPIFDVHGRVSAAMSVCAPIARLVRERCDRYGELVRDAARSVTETMSGRMPSVETGQEGWRSTASWIPANTCARRGKREKVRA